MELRHTQACRGCPWRKDSAPGWLGDSSPENFIATTLSAEEDMPCHLTVDYERPDWRETLEETSTARCAGSLNFFANYLKLPRRRELSDAVQECGKNEEVFTTPQEFLAHHQRPGTY